MTPCLQNGCDGASMRGKSAVMTTIEVTPSGSPDSQFFKVTFGE